jgi:hypothetical protein
MRGSIHVLAFYGVVSSACTEPIDASSIETLRSHSRFVEAYAEYTAVLEEDGYPEYRCRGISDATDQPPSVVRKYEAPCSYSVKSADGSEGWPCRSVFELADQQRHEGVTDSVDIHEDYDGYESSRAWVRGDETAIGVWFTVTHSSPERGCDARSIHFIDILPEQRLHCSFSAVVEGSCDGIATWSSVQGFYD